MVFIVGPPWAYGVAVTDSAGVGNFWGKQFSGDATQLVARR